MKPSFQDLTFHGKLKHKVGMLNGHLMRLHRVNQDGTAYYYCYYRLDLLLFEIILLLLAIELLPNVQAPIDSTSP